MNKRIYLIKILLSVFLLYCRSIKADQKFAELGIEGIPNPPTDLFATIIGDIGYLNWKDNSTNEDGFIIQRTLPQDTTTFIEIGRAPADTTKFIALPLPHENYIFRVLAFNEYGESEPAQVTIKRGRTTFSRVTDFEATPRFESILLTWKDHNEDEDGFVIKRDNKTIADVNKLPPNTRHFLDENLDPNLNYSYLAYASIKRRLSKPSIVVSARPLSIIPVAQHRCGLEIDNLGGGAGGWSKFETSGYDRLYDGHLQLWTGGDSIWDGDDGDFTSTTSIVLNPGSDEIDYEYTSAALGSHAPVIFKCKAEDIAVHQRSYQQKEKNWILIDWEVHNNESAGKYIKLALFLDVDAGGESYARDYGGFDKTKKIVYIKNEQQNRFVGMAIIADVAAFDSYQICHFIDPRTPDNSNFDHNGDRARKELIKNRYHTGMLHGRMDDDPVDLTMTLISNLGIINAGGSKRILYVVSADQKLAGLQRAIDEAKIFAQSILLRAFD